MKDKLTKHGKSKTYFVVRKILIISSLILLVSTTIAIPVGITLSRINTQQRS